MLGTCSLESIFCIFILNLTIRIWIYNSDELIHFHGKSVSKFSEDLIKRTSNTVEELFNDINYAVGSLSSFDSKKSCIIVSQVVEDSLLNKILFFDTNLIWVDVVFEFTNQLLDRADLSIPVESKFLDNTFEIDDRDFVTCISPKHLNLWTTDDISQWKSGGALLHNLYNFLSETVKLMSEIH